MNSLELNETHILKSLENYGDLAGSEVLTRALVAERNGDREKAVFWGAIYKKVIEKEAKDNTI